MDQPGASSPTKITSTRNPIVKRIRTLGATAGRGRRRLYLAEGARLVAEAMDAGCQATAVLYNPKQLDRSLSGARLLAELPRWAEHSYQVDARVLSAASQTEHPGGVVAVLCRPSPAHLSTHGASRFGLILDRVADPGNAGTVLRSAAAAGAQYVVSLPGSVDLFAPKVVRAGMGAHFKLPIYPDISWHEIAATLPNVAIVALDTRAQTSIYQFAWPETAALVVGSEVHGLSTEVAGGVRYRVRIPMKPGVESLNAGVAASVVLYIVLGPRVE